MSFFKLFFSLFFLLFLATASNVSGQLIVSDSSYTTPSVLTPNQDGINDEWVIEQEGRITLSVYDRNQHLIFQEQSSNRLIWRPDSNLAGNVYFYLLDMNGKILAGNITLIR